MSIYIGDFEISRSCIEDGCDSDAVRAIVMHDTDDGDMVMWHLCLPHAIHHKSQFEDQEKN